MKLKSRAADPRQSDLCDDLDIVVSSGGPAHASIGLGKPIMQDGREVLELFYTIEGSRDELRLVAESILRSLGTVAH